LRILISNSEAQRRDELKLSSFDSQGKKVLKSGTEILNVPAVVRRRV